MKLIPLTHGKFAKVDDRWFERLSGWRWLYHKKGYAYRVTSRVLGKRKSVFMHNEIKPPPPGLWADHIDNDKLNNQEHNLRHCTVRENAQNRGKQSNNRSGFKGVRWHKQNQRYRAQIVVDGVQIYLGVYKDPVEAAKAYDEAAIKYHGEFANLNFPK